jgi:inner membrane transporter RhtA
LRLLSRITIVILGDCIRPHERMRSRLAPARRGRSSVVLDARSASAIGVPRTGPHRVAASAAFLGSTGAFQLSGALAVPVFAVVGVPGTSGIRFGLAASLLLAFVRPRLRGRSRAQWIRVVLLGVAMVTMNVCSYEALQRLPLGTATTVEFLGPLAIVGALSRGIGQVLWTAVTLAGVALVGGPTLHAAPIGVLFAVLTAIALVGYLLLQGHFGRHHAGLDSLTLAITVAALVSLPFAVCAIGVLTTGAIWRVAMSAALGVVCPTGSMYKRCV